MICENLRRSVFSKDLSVNQGKELLASRMGEAILSRLGAQTAEEKGEAGICIT
jgi:hypothetical protein